MSLVRLLTTAAALGLICCFTACKDNKTKETSASTSKDSAASTSTTPKDTLSGNVMTVKAKFEGFTLGDAPHFTFKDEAGKTWDFADLEDSTYKFATELPEKEANETNQGWASNKELVGKWFNITYINRSQPQYQDGPVGNAMIITAVKPAE